MIFNYAKRQLKIVVALSILLLSPILMAKSITLTISKMNASQTLNISTLSTLDAQTSNPASNEIFIQFHQAITIPEESINDLFPYTLNYGYDSLVIKSPRNVSLSTTQTKHEINIHATSPQQKVDSLALQLALVRYQLSEGHYEQVQQTLETLHAQHPLNTSIWLATANMNNAFNFKQSALNKTQHALALEPQNISAKLLQRQLMLDDRLEYLNTELYKEDIHNWIEYGVDFQKQGSNINEPEASIKYLHAINQTWRLGFNALGQWLNTSNIKNPHNGEQKSRHQIFTSFGLLLQYLPDEFKTYTAALYSSYQNTIGFGLAFKNKFIAGNYELIGDYLKPVVDMTEAYPYGGYVNQLGVTSHYDYKLGINFHANLFLRQFGYHTQSNAATAISPFVSATYGLSQRLESLAFLKPYGQFDSTYSINAQYLTSLYNPTNSLTGKTLGLPLFTYEIHTVELSWRKKYNYHWDESLLYLGASYNRYGAQIGFILGGHIRYRFTDNVLLEVYASRGMSTTFQGQFNDQVGAKLSHSF